MLWLMMACSTEEKDSGVETSTAICEDTVSITCEDAMISDCLCMMIKSPMGKSQPPVKMKTL